MKDRIFLLLGSNQDHPLQRLAEAVDRIGQQCGEVLEQSSVYRTAAWGLEQQPDFYNQVIEIATTHSPQALLEKILDIERDMGRVRGQKWGPRIIDIDLLFYGDLIMITPTLQLPHPGIPERRFTLIPFREIAPAFRHPVSGKSAVTMLNECTDTLRVEKVVTRPGMEGVSDVNSIP